MHKFKVAVFMALIAIGLGGSLTGCFVEEDHGGHHRDWR